jgi:hypothetical protein
MEKRKNRPKSGRRIEFTTSNSLEATREKLDSLSNRTLFIGKPLLQLRGYSGKLDVEDALTDDDTIEFRLQLNKRDMEITGFLKRLNENNTRVVGVLQNGKLGYWILLALWLLACLIAVTSNLLIQSVCVLVLFGIGGWLSWHMEKRYEDKVARLFEDTLMDKGQFRGKRVKEKRKHA